MIDLIANRVTVLAKACHTNRTQISKSSIMLTQTMKLLKKFPLNFCPSIAMSLKPDMGNRGQIPNSPFSIENSHFPS